jgi:hypothetical protein
LSNNEGDQLQVTEMVSHVQKAKGKTSSFPSNSIQTHWHGKAYPHE